MGCRCQPVSIEMDSSSSGLPSTQSQAGAVFVWGLRMSPGTGTASVLFPLLPLTEESARMALAENSHHPCHCVPPQPLPAGWQGHFCSEIEIPAPSSLLNMPHYCTVTISKRIIKFNTQIAGSADDFAKQFVCGWILA